MKKFLCKAAALVIILYAVVVLVNKMTDPANLFHGQLVDALASELLAGNIVESPGDFDEGRLLVDMVSGMEQAPDTVVLGSSHVMYVPWEYENYYVAALSGAYLGDYYAVLSVLEEYDRMPKRVVIGLDSWALLSDYQSGRHSGLQPYAKRIYGRMHGMPVRESAFSEWKETCKKQTELFSFSYFQSSVKTLREYGLEYWKAKKTLAVHTVPDAKESEAPKILPNGSRVLSSGARCTQEAIRADAMDMVNAGALYQLGESYNALSEENYADFVALLSYLQAKGIEVEIYFPTWYPLLYEELNRSGRYAAVLDLESRLRTYAQSHDLILHSSYCPENAGVTEADFVDLMHLKPEKTVENYNVIL